MGLEPSAQREDRERIARELHDTVIQRLFATGLALQSTVWVVGNDPAAAASRIELAVDDLDLTMKYIRSAIFELEGSRSSQSGPRHQLLNVIERLSSRWASSPGCSSTDLSTRVSTTPRWPTRSPRCARR